MGSFDFVCCISNLPIESGTKVRYLALTENRYSRGNKFACYVHDRWQIRTVPLQGTYNDCGSIEEVKDGLARKVFFASFEQDLLPVGVGDNSFHDVVAKNGMSEEQWFEALSRGRVFVNSESVRPQLSPDSWKDRSPSYVPDFLRIEILLKEKGFAVSDHDSNEGLLIDDRKDGFVRVRQSRAKSIKETERLLSSLVPVLDAAGFVSMVTCGTGNYPNSAELLIGPKPGENRRVKGFPLDEGVKKRCCVAQSMVREDVWQILLAQKVESFVGDLSMDKFREDAREMLEKDLDLMEKNRAFEDRIQTALLSIDRSSDHKNSVRNSLTPGEGISGFSLQQSMDLAIKLHTSHDELEAFVDELAEMCFVNAVFSSLHGQWVPSRSGGSNEQWPLHRQVLKSFASIRGNYESPRKKKP